MPINQKLKSKFDQLKANHFSSGFFDNILYDGEATDAIIDDVSIGAYHDFGYVALYVISSPRNRHVAKEIHGLIKHKYDILGGFNSGLGFPTSDESNVAGGHGRFNNFQNGAISWIFNNNEAFAVFSDFSNNNIFKEWKNRSRELGSLGHPISDRLILPCSGEFNNFENGCIFSNEQNTTVVSGRCVLVTNCSPSPITARFYNPGDLSGNLVTTFPNGIHTIPVSKTFIFTLPAGFTRTNVTINGNNLNRVNGSILSLQTVITDSTSFNGQNLIHPVRNMGNSMVFTNDERVQFINDSGQNTNVNVFNFDNFIHAPLSVGQMHLATAGNTAPNNAFFNIPDDVNRIGFNFDGIFEGTAIRGDVFHHLHDMKRFTIHNNTLVPLMIRMYNPGDNTRFTPIIGTTPRTLGAGPGSFNTFQLPTGIISVQVTAGDNLLGVVMGGQDIVINSMAFFTVVNTSSNDVTLKFNLPGFFGFPLLGANPVPVSGNQRLNVAIPLGVAAIKLICSNGKTFDNVMNGMGPFLL